MFVVGRVGRSESLTLGLNGTNPRFPWQPSATMLTYRLNSTTEANGVDHDEPDQSAPPHPDRQRRRPGTQSSSTTVRIEDRALLLTWCFLVVTARCAGDYL
jgi:hypothetical protein